jgi:hypothetical protein
MHSISAYLNVFYLVLLICTRWAVIRRAYFSHRNPKSHLKLKSPDPKQRCLRSAACSKVAWFNQEIGLRVQGEKWAQL